MANLGLIKQLRSSTGCGIADCNKAIKECGDEYEACVDWLRKKGLSKAAKKSGRVTAEGIVAVVANGTKAAMVEVNSETDFVAKNDKFQEFAEGVAKSAFENEGNHSLVMKAVYPEAGHSVEEELKNRIAVIGENLNVRRTEALSVEEGVVSDYIHGQVKPGMGKIGVLVALQSKGDKAKLEELGKKIAMHVAATKPEFLSIESVDADRVERERSIFAEQAKASGKPENIIEKMVEGRIRKFFEESVLLEQAFVMDDKIKVKDLIKSVEKELNSPVSLEGYKLFILGEGIEKEEDNLADEVAKLTK